jgi:hypothetical protein
MCTLHALYLQYLDYTILRHFRQVARKGIQLQEKGKECSWNAHTLHSRLIFPIFYRRNLAFSCLPRMHYCPNNAWNWRKHSQKCWVDAAVVRMIWGGGGNGTGTWSLMTMGGRDGWRETVSPSARLFFNDRLTCIDRATDGRRILNVGQSAAQLAKSEQILVSPHISYIRLNTHTDWPALYRNLWALDSGFKEFISTAQFRNFFSVKEVWKQEYCKDFSFPEYCVVLVGIQRRFGERYCILQGVSSPRTWGFLSSGTWPDDAG